jgi:hypothetical protein
MVTKMERLLLAVDFCNRFNTTRKVTVGEVARASGKPQSTTHRHMVKACGLGLVQSHKFMRGSLVCYSFSLTDEGNAFLNSFSRMF